MLITHKSKMLRHYILAMLLLMAVSLNAWFLRYNFKNVEDHERRVSLRTSIVRELDNSILAAADAETGMRGYLLTNDETYLEPYRWAEKAIWVYLPEIKEKLEVIDDQILDLNTLEGIISAHFSVLKKIITSTQKGNLNDIDKLELLTTSKATMDKARALVDNMKKAQLARLQSRLELVARSKRNFVIALFGSTVMLCIILLAVFIQIARNYQKAELETIEKTLEARRKNFAAEVAKLIAGNINISTAGKNILSYFSRTLGIPAGRLYLKDAGQLKQYASFGTTSADDENSKNISANEMNLVQSAFDRGEIWQINNIPSNYWTISSSLGNARPTSLCFIPVIHQDQHLGIFEIASFDAISDTQLDLLLSSQEALGTGLNSAQFKERLQSLLEKTQQQAEELQTQQEELRTSNEELEQQARALESQQESLNIKNQDLENATIRLRENAKALEDSNKYKSEFLAKMSHELRTPLNGLLILSTLLIENKEKNLTQRQIEFATSINNSGNDLLMIINDILDLSKIEARKLSIRPQNFNLKSVFESKTKNFETQILTKGLKFKTELPKELENLTLYTDRQRLDQILRNFMSNAIKFTENGTITLKAKMNKETSMVTFSVADTGIGIPKDKQEQVFNAFEQADSSTSRRFGGTGLGLTISQELSILLGGKISVTSTPGIGSEFSVELPINYQVITSEDPELQHQQKLMAESALNYSKAKQQLSDIMDSVDTGRKKEAVNTLKDINTDKKTILIVEDDDSFRSSITEIVESYGFEPIQTGDGEVALAILNAHIPDAILLDIRLPGISGLGILEMIKQMPHLRHIPVHMVSAFDYQHNALRMGALGYLTKPVTLEKVHSALDRITHLLSKNLRRVLLIEDDKTQNVAISELISDTDIEVIACTNGKDAVQKVKNEIFDCIILDLTLPDVSGYEILDQLNSLEVSVPPIIIYTGKDLTDEEEKHLRRYSESIVIKGARSPERLLDEVNLFLHRVESMLPQEKQEILTQLRSQEKVFEGKTVLLVDDDIRNIFALTSALENRGLNILVARDGIEALETLNDSSNSIDAVLMDIMMPRMDGFEAMREIRKNENPKIKDVPVIALTAKAMKGDHEKCMNAGASDYLPKPVNLDNLMTVLKVWLTTKRFLN